MKENQYTKPVEIGIQYLDATYDRWWHKVDLTTLDMGSTRLAILSQVAGAYMYDSVEVATWDVRELRVHGFLCPIYKPHQVLLTAEWSYRIRMLKDARKWTQGEPPQQSPEGR